MSTENDATRVLVTSALPYANGPIHLGHLVEYLATDIYVRFLRMRGRDAIYVCASDAHGTPIELKARSLGVEPEAMVARYHDEHLADFTAFQIHFDEFHTTHSDETREHAYAIFEAARALGRIHTKEVEGLYSEVDQRFLPDRFIRGTCPRCRTPDQYGDSCESCGATYRPTDLGDPRSVISGDTPVRRSSTHYFYSLAESEPFLREWVNAADRMPEATRQFVNEWLDQGLRDWDISRDAPYFGFTIPGETDKYFYVWLDAPVGYVGATQHWCERKGVDVRRYWKDPSTRIVHVIGKDIVYFHCLFWPALLENAGYTTPARVQVHGFLTVNGEKMSKSRGTFIAARTYLDHLDPQYLRFYYASKQRPEPDDLDLNLGVWGDPDDPTTLDASSAELVHRVNAELVNKIVNFPSRVLSFVGKLDGRIGALPPEAEAIATRVSDEVVPRVAEAYERFDFATAMRLVAELAEEANGYFQEAAPWVAIKTDPERARAICAVGVNYVKVLAGLVKPVVPEWVARVERALRCGALTWDDLRFDLEHLEVEAVDIRMERIDPEAVKRMVIASRAAGEGGAASPAGAGQAAAPTAEPLEPEIAIDDFSKVDLRVGLVLECAAVEGASKLLELSVDLGEARPRNIFAGLRKHYAPEELVGRRVVVVANLAPRKMRFGVSEGMVCAATSGDQVKVLAVDGEPAPGSRIS